MFGEKDRKIHDILPMYPWEGPPLPRFLKYSPIFPSLTSIGEPLRTIIVEEPSEPITVPFSPREPLQVPVREPVMVPIRRIPVKREPMRVGAY